MKKEQIIRAWMDPEFRASLSAEERAALPESPAGSSLAELDEHHLASVVGGLIGPDQNITDFNPRLTPYIRPIRVVDLVAFQSVALRQRF